MSTLTYYTFYHLPKKEPVGLYNKIVQGYLLKWSMKECLHVHYYAFNQEFLPDDIDQFALDFFRDYNVTKNVQASFSQFVGSDVAKVQTESIPCNVTSMTFFDRLLDPNNGIVSCSGSGDDDNHAIRQCMEVFKDGMYISNKLKMMLFEDECEEYLLYSEDERSEFMFRLLQHFSTGGQWCQDDVVIEPYLNAMKYVYKDILAVEKIPGSGVQVSSKVYKIVAFDSNDTVLFPKECRNLIPYSFAYLAVNPKTRTVALFYHNVGDTIYT
ncbi:cilia- and flagella-associated protein 300-like isoform X1 [Metopolophium dirhodum]|uniref:cilia- and flagella-associated protein 300-like isoform X1 n=2 Tax=Metopolophium dirhodum TaxID=44670 RepID=UPI0029903B28|nr:cilia- and flagella-associated protein 300-like isoform X1 [Metopolophium dirhodum]